MLFVGIDVGGTNIKLGVVDDRGRVLTHCSFPTFQDRGPQYAIDQATVQLQNLFTKGGLNWERVAAIGLGTPGTMDIPRGMILEPPNMPGWRHYPVRDRLSAALQRPVTYANDANAAAYGEFWVGAASDYASLVFFTLGTGVGGGVVIDHFLVEGAHSLGGEVGHIRIDWSDSARLCSCGSPGHLEAYASATALVARCRELLANADCSLSTLQNVKAENMSARAIAMAAESGDILALRLVNEVADSLARGISIVANLLDPQAIMLGGAMTFGGNASPLGRQFLQRVREQVALEVFPQIKVGMTIDFASLGSEAGFIGAAGLARQQYLKSLQPQS